MLKKYIVLQDGLKECGSACLLSIIRYYQGNISMQRLLELTKTTKDGTNFYNMSLAAKELGFISKGYKVDDFELLKEIDKPFVSQIIINNYYHFVVVYKIKNNKVTIMDPAKGIINISLDKFKSIYTGYILLLEPYKKIPIYTESNYLINLVKETIYNNKNLIIKLLFFTIIIAIFTCIYSYNFKIIIDKVIRTNKLNLLIVTIIFIIILTLNKLSSYLRNNLVLYLNQKLDLSIITTTIKKIITLPYSYYKNKTTGEMIARINDLFYIKNTISKIITNLFLDNILALIVVFILMKINTTMTLLLIFLTIIYFLIFLIYKNSIKNITNDIQEENAKVNSLLVESISSYETIKGLHLEETFVKKINKKYLKNINKNIFLNRVVNSEELLISLSEGIIILFVNYLGATYIMDNTLTIGSLLTYNTLLSYYLIPLKNSLDFYKELYYVKNSISRINNILNYKYELVGKKNNLSLQGDIEVKNLSFSYNNHNILESISLKIPSKSKVMVLGSSGSGKSTFLKILYKYYEVKRGMISFGKYDICDFTTEDIRTNITYISQNELLFTDTIRNNIILNREVSEEEFINVCNLTYVNDIVKNNPFSYDYPLEECGVNLSGGQRQRIILARALLKKSNIILIDEGLNEIDINLERKILKNIFSYYKDNLFIIVSHRLDNLDLYDNVINIEAGNVKEVYQRHG